ncbi:glycosyltransferase 61 family protein [Asticcacaulis sp.]|uniref:glycosyltransferase family 61 protein n=1 Tax=Asticcacaulis sp. TaxID=1872648 RepID=UPI002617D12C|nr:glycosyltransferase 61 family protein [Asticcacaulis sp.]
MTAEIKYEYLEHIAIRSIPTDGQDAFAGFVTQDGKIAFDRVIDSPFLEFDEKTLIRFGPDDHIHQEYKDALATPGFIASGIIDFNQYAFVENCALPIDFDTNEAVIGEPLCWGCDFALWYAERHKLPKMVRRFADPCFRRQLDETLDRNTIRGEAVVLSAPGQDIYGHWLLDMLPRLNVLREAGLDSLPVYCDSVPRWAAYFLKSFGLDIDAIRPHPSRFFRVEHAKVPTSSKSGFRLGGRALEDAWAQVRPPAVYSMPISAMAEKIFFSRRGWSKGNRESFDNIDALERAAQSRGYRIVSPQDYTVEQQLLMMREARIVIGEDGSALHNIVFAQPGIRLGVLSLRHRNNLWHYGIAHIKQGHVAYIFPENHTPKHIEVSTFHEFVDALEA